MASRGSAYLALWLTVATLAQAASEFTFSLTTPFQCQNMTVNIQGGKGPYELLIIPVGSVVPEVRKIIDITIPAGVFTSSFQLAFPYNSQFVALMSDSTGVNAGGTGIPQNVAISDDSSCFHDTISPKFYFYIDPLQLKQCATTTVSWNSSAQGQVTMLGLIPGGESFQLPIPSTGSTYQWKVNVRAGTSVQLIAGDSRGKGTGGSTDLLVVQGGDSGCIDNSSPSSTAGSPAGSVTGGLSSTTATTSQSATGSITSPPTSSTSAGGGGGGGGGSGGSPGKKSSTNIGAIVGGVIGGVGGLVILGLILFFCLRRGKDHEKPYHNDVDLINEESSIGGHVSSANPPMIEPGFYHPEPFVVPQPGMPDDSDRRPSNDRARTSFSTDGVPLANVAAESAVSGSMGGRQNPRHSQLSLGQTESSDPGSRRTRKSHPPTAMRPVNFIQHDDAGAVEAEPSSAAQEEVVELPPTYASVPGAGSGAPTS